MNTPFIEVKYLFRGRAYAEDIAAALKLTRATTAKRLANPQDFTLAELETVRKALHIDAKDLHKAIKFGGEQ